MTCIRTSTGCAKITPTPLTKAYTEAAARNVRADTIEAFVDSDAVASGAAAAVEL